MKHLPPMLALALLAAAPTMLLGGRARRPEENEPPPETRPASRSVGYVGPRYVPQYERKLSASDAAAIDGAKEKRARKALLRDRNAARAAAGRQCA